MKDIVTYSALGLMAKVAAKKEKATAKNQKEPKSSAKAIKSSKVNKLISVKKPKSKGNDTARKKQEKKSNSSKKSEDKKEPKKRQTKESKGDKQTKTEVGTKRKYSRQNNQSKKNGDYAPLAKIQKVLSGHCEGNKLVNGNVPTVLPQAPRNPWVLKLDISQKAKPVPNGVPSNGTLPICSKSVIFIPKNNAVSDSILKRRPSLPFVKKDDIFSENSSQPTKQTMNKNCAAVNKETIINGVDFNNLSIPIQDSNETSLKKSTDVSSSKVQKSNAMNGEKLSLLKSCEKEGKSSSSKKRNVTHSKDQIQIDSKPIKNEKPVIGKNQLCLVPKEQKTPSAKNQKVSKESKPCGNRGKKAAAQDTKALCLREPAKVHPQRMASLDAMAKMHVICTTDRRAPMEVSKAAKSNESSTTHIKNSSQRIHVGIKKETHVIHSRINCVKYEESSITEGTENVRTFCSISQEQEQTVSKRPRGRPKLKSTVEAKASSKGNRAKVKTSKTRTNEPKRKSVGKKETKKASEKTQKSKKKEEDTKKKTPKQKVEKKVKVKETIRMRKTCTYQSVTTVSSHKAVNSVVSSCSRVGVTTNFETKKTVVRDTACENDSNLRLEDLHCSFLPSLHENPCAIQHSSSCCSHAPHPASQIPLAHSQSCHGHEATDGSHVAQSMCDNSYPRCGNVGALMCHRLSHDYGYNCGGRGCYRNNVDGCRCSSSLAQSMHESCLPPKENCAPNSFCHLNSTRCLCSSCCHNSSPKEHEQHYNLPSTSNYQNRWCTSHEPYSSAASMAHPKVTCTSCPTMEKSYTSIVPFDQIPLDLSMGTQNSLQVDKPAGQSRISCQTHCFNHGHDIFPSSYHQNCQNSHHCNCVTSCPNRNSECKEQEKPYPMQVSYVDGQLSSLSLSDVHSTELICQEISSTHNYACNSTKQNRNDIHQPVARHSKFAHGWSWEGGMTERKISLTNDSLPSLKRCYPALRHREGDIIEEGDCVLLKSGPKETDLPYVAKVAAFWENPDDGEMMMSLLWYYRPEHTEQGRNPDQMDNEVFASKHRDVNSVACIEDKCFVLTFNEYCRYQANLLRINATPFKSITTRTVPESIIHYPRIKLLPPMCISPDMIFFCRHVYDFRQKRILKNPT